MDWIPNIYCSKPFLAQNLRSKLNIIFCRLRFGQLCFKTQIPNWNKRDKYWVAGLFEMIMSSSLSMTYVTPRDLTIRVVMRPVLSRKQDKNRSQYDIGITSRDQWYFIYERDYRMFALFVHMFQVVQFWVHLFQVLESLVRLNRNYFFGGKVMMVISFDYHISLEDHRYRTSSKRMNHVFITRSLQTWTVTSSSWKVRQAWQHHSIFSRKETSSWVNLISDVV